MDPANRVVAIGSPHGDDRAAWQVAEWLRHQVKSNSSVVALSDPSQLLNFIDNCDRLIVIDACRGSGLAGTISRLQWPDSQIIQRKTHSTHGVSIAEVLQLAESLGRLPMRVMLFAIEVTKCDPGASLSSAVRQAISELQVEVLRELDQQ